MSFSVPSGNNTFVPSHEATGYLLEGFSRNPITYKINRWLQRVPVKNTTFYYAQSLSQQSARLTTASNAILPGAEFQWNDGQDAPSGLGNSEQFNFVFGETQRYAPSFVQGRKAVDQANWNVLAWNAGSVAGQLMTLRTQQAYNAVVGSSAPTNTATTLAGGKFNAGTPTTPYCKPGLMKAFLTINKSTLGKVQPKDVAVVMNPNTATQISYSQEITDAIKFSAGYSSVLSGGIQTALTPTSNYGLGPDLFGFEAIVDETVVITTSKNTSNSATPAYVIPDGTILMISKPGGLEGVEGGPSWSSVMGFFYEEMTVESKYDEENRLYRGRVVSDYIILVSQLGSAATYIITAAI